MTSRFLKPLAVACFSIGLFSSANANMAVSFDEGAPKDRFTLTNTSNCALRDAKLTLDLSGSKSGLIFDVTNQGAGVEVFQPLEFVSGTTSLSVVPKVKDGDNRIELNVKDLAAGSSIAFTIDVDDTMGGREITVSGSEISGATVELAKNNKTVSGVFGSSAKTNIAYDFCT